MEACPFDLCIFVFREDSHVPAHPDDHPDPKFHAKGKIVGILGIMSMTELEGAGKSFKGLSSYLNKNIPLGPRRVEHSRLQE